MEFLKNLPEIIPSHEYKAAETYESVDRHGSKGIAVFNFDERWTKVRVKYVFDAPFGARYFEDDHLRGLNKNFKDPKGRAGGRDDRLFFRDLTLKAKHLLDELLEKREQIVKEIENLESLSPDSGVNIVCRHVCVGKGYSYNDYKGSSSESSVYEWIWYAEPTGRAFNTIRDASFRVRVTDKRLFGLEAPIRFENANLPEKDRQEFTQKIGELKSIHDKYIVEKIDPLKKKLRELDGEINVFKVEHEIDVVIKIEGGGSGAALEAQPRVHEAPLERFWDKPTTDLPPKPEVIFDIEATRTELPKIKNQQAVINVLIAQLERAIPGIAPLRKKADTLFGDTDRFGAALDRGQLAQKAGDDFSEIKRRTEAVTASVIEKIKRDELVIMNATDALSRVDEICDQIGADHLNEVNRNKFIGKVLHFITISDGKEKITDEQIGEILIEHVL